MLQPASREANCCPRCNGEAYVILFQTADTLYRTTDRKFHIVECERCGLIRLYPRPTQQELGAFYPDNYWWNPNDSALGRLTEIYRRAVLWDHVRFVAEAAAKLGAPVLDAGCGGGSLVAALRKRGIAAVGLDMSFTAARVSASAANSAVVCGALPAVPFPRESFGAVTLFHVLEHSGDPAECLLAARKLLVPGGRLFIQVPNAASWQFLLFGKRWSGLDVPRHLINFRASDLEDLLEGCGFRILRRRYFSLRDNPASLATSLCPGLEPVVRRVRKIKESALTAMLKNLLYFAVVTAATPVALAESVAKAGATFIVEARRDETS